MSKTVILNNKEPIEFKEKSTTIKKRISDIVSPSIFRRRDDVKEEPFVNCIGENEDETVYASKMDGFAYAFYCAYNTHGTVVLSPDHLLAHVLNQLTLYISAREEEFRPLFSLRESGKETIQIHEGEVEGPRWCKKMWLDLTAQFVHRAMNHNPESGKKILESLTTQFSTTDSNQRVCRNMASMAVVKNYFDYRFCLMCGINKVKFLGTDEDWDKLMDVLTELQTQFDKCDELLSEVLDPIIEIYGKFCLTRQEKLVEANKEWWQKIFLEKHLDGSGPQLLFDGWIKDLYRVKNDGSLRDEEKKVEPEDLESVLSQGNMTIIYEDGTEKEWKYSTGFIGVKAHDNNYRPCNTWWVGCW